MQLVFLGPPGAGKGTLAARAAAKYGFAHLSTGDILRAEINRGTELGEKVKGYVVTGRLVPQEILGAVVAARLAGEKSFVLDGYPRTREQAEFLAMLPGVKLDAVIYVDVPEEEVVRRLGTRRVCPACGAVGSAHSDGDTCGACGAGFVTRDDDRPETIRSRYRVYSANTAPLIDYYRAAGVLREVAGAGTKDEVWARLDAELARLDARAHDNH